jgi:hypothetical protein
MMARVPILAFLLGLMASLPMAASAAGTEPELEARLLDAHRVVVKGAGFFGAGRVVIGLDPRGYCSLACGPDKVGFTVSAESLEGKALAPEVEIPCAEPTRPEQGH